MEYNIDLCSKELRPIITKIHSRKSVVQDKLNTPNKKKDSEKQNKMWS